MDIFKDLETVTGAEVIHHFKLTGKNVYLIGEDHYFNGVKNHPYIVDTILHSPRELTLLLECGTQEVFTAAESVRHNGKSKSPTQEVAYRFINQPFTIRNDIRLVDIRRDDPFSVLEIMTSFDSYLFMNKHHQVSSLKSYKALLKKAKMFEKEAFDHFKSRTGMERFVLGLIHPERKHPVWFSKWCSAFGHSGEEHAIKDELRQLRTKDGQLYDLIVKFIRDQLDYQLLDVTIFSRVMESMEKERRTASVNMMLDKSVPLNTFFVSLFGLVMDVNILLRTFQVQTDICILAGAQHVFNIAQVLKNHENLFTTAYTIKMNPMGYFILDEKTALDVTNPLLSPEELLKEHKKQK